MKKTLIYALALSLLLLAGCTSPKAPLASQETSSASSAPTEAAAKAVYHKITPEEAKAMMDKGGVVIVDVRTEGEYQEKHIKNAVLVPNESISSQKPELLPDVQATLLVYCRSGRRSADASQKLLALGYQNVYDFGGISAWPYETEAGNP